MAGLVACVAFYAGRFLDRHSIDGTGFAVRARWQMAEDRPAGVEKINVTVISPQAMPPQRLPALLAPERHPTRPGTG